MGRRPLNNAIRINPVIDRLENILDRGDIPAPYDRWGARLLAHLTKPVQVVVTGLAGSGKSALIEMMSAQPVIGQHVDVPVIELIYGEKERVLFERQDGSITSFSGCLKDCECPQDSIRARQELPDTKLISQNFVEIGLSGSLVQKRAILGSVIARADIIIWCSQEFSEEEQHLWATAPDQIKDHSFLVLTMADRQLMRDVLSKNITRLESIVADEFMGLYPVATIQGITAQTSGEGLNQALWTSSGGKHLMDPVLKQIKQGRSADIDQARIFLDRLAARTPEVDVEGREARQMSDPVAVDGSDTKEKSDAAAIADDVAENVVAADDMAADARAVELLSEAVDMLQQHARKMLDDVDQSDDLDADAILNSCTEAMSSLAGLLDTAQTNDPAARGAREDVQEGEEMLMLFQLERGEEAALDAVTLLLQIRKELIQKVAS